MFTYLAIIKGSLILFDCGNEEDDEKNKREIMKQIKYIKKEQCQQIIEIGDRNLIILEKYQLYFLCLTSQKKFETQGFSLLNEISNTYFAQQKLEKTENSNRLLTKNLQNILNKYNLDSEIIENKFENIQGQNQEEIQIQNSDNLISLKKDNQDETLNSNKLYSYTSQTCKQVFFIINLLMTGLLIEFIINMHIIEK